MSDYLPSPNGVNPHSLNTMTTTTPAEFESIARADGFTIERMEALEAYSRAAIAEDIAKEIDREDYLAALDDALGSTPRPRPRPWSAGYEEGYREGRHLHLDACL